MELVRGNQNEQQNSDPQGHSKRGKWKKRKSFVFFLWRLYYPSLTQQLERTLGKSEKNAQKTMVFCYQNCSDLL